MLHRGCGDGQALRGKHPWPWSSRLYPHCCRCMSDFSKNPGRTGPIACQQVLQEYKEYNDPVRQFFQEMEFSFTWSLLPFQFLYDLYKAWFARNNPKGSIQGRNTFIKEFESDLSLKRGNSFRHCTMKPWYWKLMIGLCLRSIEITSLVITAFSLSTASMNVPTGFSSLMMATARILSGLRVPDQISGGLQSQPCQCGHP